MSLIFTSSFTHFLALPPTSKIQVFLRNVSLALLFTGAPGRVLSSTFLCSDFSKQHPSTQFSDSFFFFGSIFPNALPLILLFEITYSGNCLLTSYCPKHFTCIVLPQTGKDTLQFLVFRNGNRNLREV